MGFDSANSLYLQEMLQSMFEPSVRESDIAYHNGVLAANNVTQADKEKNLKINDKYSEEYSNGFLYGISLTEDEFKEYMSKYKEAEVKRKAKKPDYETWNTFGDDGIMSQVGKLLGLTKKTITDKSGWI